MEIKLFSPSAIKRYPGNPRKNEETVEAVAQSIQTFGFLQPVVVDKNMVIVVGDTRYQAALSLKLKKIPVVVASALTPEQIRAYRLVDNKVGEMSGWDEEKLLEEVMGLMESGFDIQSFGFSAEEAEDAMTPLTKEDKRHLEDFDVAPKPKPRWILISAPEDDCATIMNAIKKLKVASLKMECSAFSAGETE